MEGLAFIVALFAGMSFWYAAGALYVAVLYARHGLLALSPLIVGSAELWAGGMFALAAGSLVRVPPALPDRWETTGWTTTVFILVMAIVLQRKPEVEAAQPDAYRRSLDGRYVLAGVVVTVVVLALYGLRTPDGLR